ncbi:Putative ribosome biogenesis GTPase RsgA [Pigmentiphaga humi]|uniref:Small ribosomal subunit biogenesis GTPase RsgA n=1 Tax=Pigmentiphaga humi TaxID=2478468 RepID=A0A3P4B4E8_9BURK|nr:ribosome small subunit-dependent GTPase A [Pigmentiphaga humi]VCU71153.1 Putative ribosome biogenesis GTPase RsgA [Pigmentiphaga humi]
MAGPRTKPPRRGGAATLQGRVIAAFGRHFTVEFEDGSTRQCYPRGKKGTAAVGDWVVVAPEGPAEGAIESVVPRRNLLYRSDEMRTKQFAANVDQLLIVVATEPEFSEELVGRALVGARNAGIEPVVLLNKADLPAGLPAARARLAPIAALGITVLELSAHRADATRASLAPLLAGRTSLLLGQSGMGKSTLLNALVPDAGAATREHSQALGAGKHTTTSTRLYHVPAEVAERADLIDSPGFQAFGLQHLDGTQLVHGFPEFEPYLGQCRFYNCTHVHEPGCAVLEALQAGRIAPPRHALYRRLLEELELGKRY